MKLRLVYLFREASNCLFYYNRFVESINWEEFNHHNVSLVILYKGQGTISNKPFISSKLKGKDVEFDLIDVPDRGFDLGAYAYYLDGKNCFCMLLNSYAYFRDSSALSKIYRYMHEIENYHRLKSLVIVTSISLSSHGVYPLKKSLSLNQIMRNLLYYRWNLSSIEGYPSFPNLHFRTNGFIIHSHVYSEYMQIFGCPKNKQDCHLIESGENSLTNWLFQNNYNVVFFGSSSITDLKNIDKIRQNFRQDNQNELMVGDNQVDAYQKSTWWKKKMLNLKSWN